MSKAKTYRHTILGKRLVAHKESIVSKAIDTRIPQKWVFVDTEFGNIYGFNKSGWTSVDIEILKAARLCMTREINQRTSISRKTQRRE
jgi:hypothetical protein